MIAVTARGGEYIVQIGSIAHTLTPADFQQLARLVIDCVQAETAERRKPKPARAKGRK